ncbi:MAG: rod-binding protein [Pseudomonadaceae bacterium]|nr:rod-binding protein [Pseudomonadaceae bacterium]
MAAISAPVINPALAAAVPQATKDKLQGKAREFEAYFIQQFISLTRPDMSDNEVFGGGFSEQVYGTMMDEQMATGIANRGGFGIANRVYAEMLQAQAATLPPAAAVAQNYTPQPQQGARP